MEKNFWVLDDSIKDMMGTQIGIFVGQLETGKAKPTGFGGDLYKNKKMFSKNILLSLMKLATQKKDDNTPLLTKKVKTKVLIYVYWFALIMRCISFLSKTTNNAGELVSNLKEF